MIPHDTLFTTPLDANARFSFDEQVVACFPDMIRRSVPGYGQILAMLPIFAKRHCSFRQVGDDGNKVSRVYDLGCRWGGEFCAGVYLLPKTYKSKPLMPSLCPCAKKRVCCSMRIRC